MTGNGLAEYELGKIPDGTKRVAVLARLTTEHAFLFPDPNVRLSSFHD